MTGLALGIVVGIIGGGYFLYKILSDSENEP